MSQDMLQNLRGSLNKRLGEIIQDFIGDDALREKFDQAGGHPVKYEGMPTGVIALKMGIVDEQTKDALLIAQAAERTLTIAEKIEAGEATVFRFLDDPVFQHIGSEGDSQQLIRAQSIWHLAEAYRFSLKDEQEGKFAIRNGRDEGLGNRYVGTLKQASANLFEEAAELLEGTEHAGIAQNMRALAANALAQSSPTLDDMARGVQWKLLNTMTTTPRDVTEPDMQSLRYNSLAHDQRVLTDIQTVKEIAGRIENPEPKEVRSAFARAAGAVLDFVFPNRVSPDSKPSYVDFSQNLR